MSRREKRQPEAPQPQEVAIEAPEGLPSYLAFRPEVDTVEMHQAVQQMLQMIDRKLSTSNHLQAHTAIKDLVLPLMLTFYEWTIRAQRDQLRHTDELAAFQAANVGGPGVPAELVLRLTNYFHIAKAVLKSAEAALKKVEPAPAFAAEVQEAAQSLRDLEKATDDLEEEVYEYYDEDDEEDEDDEDEDEDDDDADEVGDIDPDEVGVDEDEPLFEDEPPGGSRAATGEVL